jgi:hypothetical protein
MEPPITPAEQEQCDAMYALLKPEAIAEARKYVQVRTPPRLQEAMTAKIDADFPPPPEALAAAAPAPAPAPAPVYTPV